MSEFQHYQFQAIDRPLTTEERKEVSSWSSRARVSSTSASFVYHYGDFPKDPKRVLIEYFDAMLYISNWGTQQLLFHFPRKVVNERLIKQYNLVPTYSESYVNCYTKGDSVVLDICLNDEEGLGWLEEGDYELGDLIALREDIINGDYRLLLLAWLAVAEQTFVEPEVKVTESEHFEHDDYYDDGEREDDESDNYLPPIPANLNRLNASLQSFVNYFGVNQDYIAAAASSKTSIEQPTIDYEALLKKLPRKEQESFLLRLLKNEPLLDKLLRKRLEEFTPQTTTATVDTISWEELLARSVKEGNKRLKEEIRLSKIAHEKKMEKVERNKEQHWKSVFFNLDKKTGKSYDHATATLKDLHDMYAFRGMSEVFKEKMMDICEEYGRSRVLLNRFQKAGLPYKSK